MAEVKELFLGGLRIRWIALALWQSVWLFIVFTKAKRKRLLCRSYQIVLAVSGGLACILRIAAAIDFNAVFVKFHHIFFDNDLWLFDPTEDYMIRMLPEGLLRICWVVLVFCLGGGLLFLLAVSIICMEKRKN